ncbi:hypothetical protein CK503_08045 [Aliifodinibius salipaludis]|uniref:Thioredoxin domain-containing protein n=1 Tax=Fodinibius salipaludis TaxID=2032627 RepID=A0A2A2GBE7_9BACT|nr:redoxin domain-containing protein [Aliifodinibius salipaludis]PAU94155.1 hypothetical protein CK503_08045 [Aliifodinibius salipaludis]
MKLFVFLLLGILSNLTSAASHQPVSDSVTVTFEVAVPETTPEDATIFGAGSLNSWDPGNQGKGFGQKEYAQPLTYREGSWTTSITAPKNSEESYKYTRGSIYSAEERADYTYRPTRKVVFNQTKTVRDTVEAWHDIPPKSLTQNWPHLKLKEADITIMSDDHLMDGIGTVLYDKATGTQFYDFNKNATQVKEIPDNFYDATYYYQKVSATTDDLQLISAAKTAPEGPWNIFVDQNGDKKISKEEKVFTISNDEEKYEWSGKIPVKEIKNNNTIIDSVTFSLQYAPDLPRGYTSSPGTNAPDLTFELPLKNRRATYNDQIFYVSTLYFIPFSSHNQVLIDRNQNDTLEVGSGSNEVYSSDLSQMRRKQKFFSYPSFELGENSWQVANIEPHGEWIRLRPAPNKSAKKKIADGQPAPDWQATAVTGKILSSENLRGKYILLDFWGSWCGPCIQEIPLLKKTYQQFKDQNFEMIGFAYQSRESLDKALEKYQLPWPQITDEKGKCSSKFLVRGYPTHYLIGPDGKVLEKGSSLSGQELIPTIEQYLK